MKKGFIKKISIILILLACVIFYWNSYDKNKGLRVLSWENNYYNEDNIQLYYEPIKVDIVDKRLSGLNKVYKLDEVIGEQNEELDMAIRITDIVNNIVSYDGIPSSLYLNGYDILKEKGENKKVSERDMAIITRDLFLAYGYEARVCEFRKESPQFNKNSSYYAVEYWSPKYNKWVMIDFKYRGYVEKNGEALSAYEILYDDLKKTSFEGTISNREYNKNIKEYLSSYSIAIDNTLDAKKSNSYITLIKDKKAVDIKYDSDKFIAPTIYTENKELFQLSPWSKVEKKDERGYIILKKKNATTSDMTEEEKIKLQNTFIIGGFKDSSIMKKYYLNINGEGFEEVDAYKEYEFKIGENTIEISLDGINTSSNIAIIRDKQ
ncbi:MAG: hypothetical protein ACRC2K_05150 [Clostridium sp.]